MTEVLAIRGKVIFHNDVEVLRRAFPTISPAEVEKLMEKADDSRDGVIDYGTTL